MARIVTGLVNGVKQWVETVKTSLTATPPTLESGELAFTELDGCLHYKDTSGVVRQTPLANKFTWPPNILEDIEISFTASQVSASTGNIALSSLGGERRLVRVIGPLTHNPSLAADGWRYIFLALNPTGSSTYLTSTSDRAGTGLNVTHLRRCIGACQILGGAIASVYSGNPDNPNSPLRIKAPHAIAKSREGLLLTRISGTQIEVGSGVCTVDLGGDRYLVELSTSTKTVDVSTNVWRYVFITYNPATDTVDWTVDTSSTGANISASLAKRLIGTFKINSGVIHEFLNRSPGYFEYTSSTPNRRQVWAITNTGELRAIEVPQIPLFVEAIFTSGIASGDGWYSLRFSSPDNQFDAIGSYAGESSFDADIYSSYSLSSTANSYLGASIIKTIYTSNAQIYTKKNNSGAGYHTTLQYPTSQVLSYQLIL